MVTGSTNIYGQTLVAVIVGIAAAQCCLMTLLHEKDIHGLTRECKPLDGYRCHLRIRDGNWLVLDNHLRNSALALWLYARDRKLISRGLDLGT